MTGPTHCHHVPVPTAAQTDRGPRAASGAGLALGLLCVGLAVAVLVAALAGHRPLVGADMARGIVAGVAFGGLGGLIVWRRPRLTLGWLMLAVGLSNAASTAADTWATTALVTSPGSLPGGTWAYWFAGWAWVPGYLLPVTSLLLLFPTGRVPSSRWRPLGWLAALTVVVATVGWALTPYEDQDFAPHPAFGEMTSPLSVPGAGALVAVSLPAFLLGALGCLASLAVRWRSARGPERTPLLWVLVAGGTTLLLFGAALSLGSYVPGLVAAAMVPLPAAITVAVLRQGLWQIDLLLSRTMVYAGLTVVILVAYAALVAGAGLALGDLGDGERLLALVAAAVATQPVHGRLQRGVNRMLFADRDEPWAAVDRLAERLEGAQHDVVPTVVLTVTRALRLPWAAIDAPGRPRVQHGSPGPVEVAVPLLHRGREVGTLRVSPRVGESGLGGRERDLLDRLARHAAVATHAAALQEDLQHSRERLVLSREEERRRLRRDLHDDLGPALSAAAMKLEAAGVLVDTDPGRARTMLARAEEALRASVADVRRIVDDLRPPSLDGLGLVGALREALDQFEGGPIALTLRVDPEVAALDGMPAAVEVAAYRIAAEAVNNAVRHARPGTVSVALSLADGDLVVDVADDGSGLTEELEVGVGLESMHERAAELGGSCSLTSGPDGTRVVARLPLEGS
jgi:two-component system NarL family sensor kinase